MPFCSLRKGVFFFLGRTPPNVDIDAGFFFTANTLKYCGGESAGGFSQHSLARCACPAYIAGKYAAEEKPAV